MGMSVLRMVDSLVTLVDEVNLDWTLLLAREGFGLEAEDAGVRRWPTASNRLLPATTTPKWVLVASESLRHILNFLSFASWEQFT